MTDTGYTPADRILVGLDALTEQYDRLTTRLDSIIDTLDRLSDLLTDHPSLTVTASADGIEIRREYTDPLPPFTD